MTDRAQPIDRQTATTEYVVGTARAFSKSRLQALSWSIDDLTAEFGDDLYSQMLYDPQTIACVNILRSSIIEEGMQLTPAVSDADADGYDLAHEIHTLCMAVLDDLEIPLDDVLWDMLAAIALGSRVAELVWEQRAVSSVQARQLLTLRAIKVKPRRATAFVVDPFLNVRGLIGTRTDGLFSLGAVALPLASDADILPREKFMVLSFRPRDGDPRGSSILRPAYTPWQLKRNVYPEWFKYLAQFASPSIYGVVGEHAQPTRVQAIDGTMTTIEPVQALQDALIAYQNGSALAVPYGTVIGLLEAAEGGGAAFHAAFTHCDTQIAMGILHQTLATMEAQHQARASSEVHQDTLETIIRQAKRGLCGAFRRDVLRPLVAYNYGDTAAATLTPYCSLGSVEQQDLAAMMNAVANLARAQYLDMSQLPGVDAILNLPPRVALAPIDTQEEDADATV